MSTEKKGSTDFIHEIIDEHNKTGRFDSKVYTRFPPEPNGYLHIGHAKSICLNFGIAGDYSGNCNLRFDDTNPAKEEQEFVDSIKEDVSWLGFKWTKECFASDYYEQLYDWAIKLIKDGKAYVCDLTDAEIREYRGTSTGGKDGTTPAGKDSPYRNRSVEENLDLFQRMRDGEFEDGSKTLRAKIDMAHPNLNMRDPVMYRILRAHHHRTGDKWCIYPMYDFTHGQSDSIEGITHSICTLEFENHRPLYDWYIENIGIYAPQQIEFARLNLTYTVLSKRRLLTLVNEKYVNGWDDPRMPTISGYRRKGYTADAIREFCKRIGVAKADSRVDIALLEHCLRDDLNKKANRYLGVMDPVKLVITNYPEDKRETLTGINNPEDESAGTREIPFSNELYIERSDFMEEPMKKFFRLAPGREVRLRYAYLITCTDIVKDASGNIIQINCTYDPESRGGNAPDGRKVKGTIHWVSAKDAVKAEIRLYDYLFTDENPDALRENWLNAFNQDSLKKIDAFVEPSVSSIAEMENFQFERTGYFIKDKDSTADKLVLNRTIGLKDSWAKIKQKSTN